MRVSQRNCLDLVVRDIDGRDLQLALKVFDLNPHDVARQFDLDYSMVRRRVAAHALHGEACRHLIPRRH